MLNRRQYDTWWSNPDARQWRCPPPLADVLSFYAGFQGYAPTALIEIPSIARELGVGRVFVKDESSRFGLPAFKVLGVSWAVYRALSERAGALIEPAQVDHIRERVAALLPLELVTATDGNHGRAVARMAHLFGLTAHILVPDNLPAATISAIEAEGARVTVVAGTYDDTVRLAAQTAAGSPSALLIQDTAWPGYAQVPQWTVEGYSTLFAEADRQLRDAGIEAPSLVAVPVGVGSLLQAAITHYRRDSLTTAPSVLSVEPETAACVLASLQRGELGSIATGETVMAGLNCGTPSFSAWPFIAHGLDAAIATSDAEALRAVAELAALGIAAGPSGAASLAGVRTALAGESGSARRSALRLDAGSTMLLINTEGVLT